VSALSTFCRLIINKRAFLSIFVFASATIGITGCKRSAGAESEPALRFESDQVNLGEINENGSKDQAVTVTNTSDLPISIMDVRASCGCTHARVEPSVIQPKAKAKLFLRLAAEGRKGLFESSITVFWQLEGTQYSGSNRIKARAISVTAADLNPPNLDLGVSSNLLSEKSGEVVINRGSENLNFTKIRVGNSPRANIEIFPKDAGWLLRATIFPIKMSAGKYRDEIELVLEDEQGVQLGKKSLYLSGEIRGAARAKPSSIYLGSMKQGETKSGKFILNLDDGIPADIRSISTEPYIPELVIQQAPVDKQTVEVDYRMQAKAPFGNRSGRIVVQFSDARAGMISIPIVVYVGKPPA
jgi:hypothetical protein